MDDGEKISYHDLSATAQQKADHWIKERNGFIEAAEGHRDESIRNFTHALSVVNANKQNLTPEELQARNYVTYEYGEDKIRDQRF